MNSRTQKFSEQFSDSQDSLRGIYNADHHDPEVVNAHNQAYYASKAQHLKEQVKDSFASAKDTLLSAKDQVFGAPIKPIQGGMPGRNHPHPETLDAAPATEQIPLARSEIEKDSIDSEAAKDKLEQRMTPIEGMPGPGRYHPHPDKLENVGLATKAVDIMKVGLDTAKASLVSAKDATVAGLSSAQTAVKPALASAQTHMKSGVRRSKKMIWRKKVQPIEGGMPGRNHPHPERFYHYVGTPAPFSSLGRGLTMAQTRFQTRFVAAKKRVFAPTIKPIASGMPGRNHPNAARLYAPVPTLMDRAKTTWTGTQSTVQHEVHVAKRAIFGEGKNSVFGQKMVPIEGGMPGRNHPHAERFYAPTPSMMDRAKTGWTATQSSVQQGLISAQTGLLTAKNKVWGETIVPIEGGMPGRNHPNAERFYAPTPSMMDRAKTGWATTQSSVQQGLVSAQTGLLTAKNKVWGEKIVPIEGGMPGRNHPNADRLYAPTPSFMERVQTGLTTGFTTVQSGLTTGLTGLTETKKRVWGAKTEPIEGGMPGRNHPHAERFYAPTPTLMEKVKTGFSGTTERVWGSMPEIHAPGVLETMNKKVRWMLASKVHPIEGGMPGRNHPHAERFQVQQPGLLTKIRQQLVGDKHEAVPVEMQGPSEIDTTSINQEATKEVLEATLAKETIHPLQGMPGPGRNHPMADSLKATDQGFVSNLADKWKVYSVL